MKSLSNEQLLRIVGPDRGTLSEEEVRAAEAELLRRAGSEQEIQAQKLRRAGLTCAVLGTLFFLWGTAAGVFAFIAVIGTAPPGGDENGLIFRHFNALFVSTAVLEATAGLSLLAGGAAVRKLQPWGRLAIIGPIIAAMLWVVVFTIESVVTVVTWLGKPQLISAFPALVVVLMAAFWLFILNIPLRYFRSSRVRQLLASNGGA